MSIYIKEFPAFSSVAIAKEMHQVSRIYRFDVFRLANLDLFQLFDLVKNIPYVVESDGFQSLSRPVFTLSGIAPYTACANKSIVISAYCKLLGIETAYQLVSLDSFSDYHHVFPVVYLNNTRLELDATYPENEFGQVRNWSKSIEIGE